MKNILKTRFKELDKFLISRNVDYTTEIVNFELLEFIVSDDDIN